MGGRGAYCGGQVRHLTDTLHCRVNLQSTATAQSKLDLKHVRPWGSTEMLGRTREAQ